MRLNLSYTTDEAQLVQRCKNNEPAAQRILYDRYVEDIMILCLRYLTNTEDAKEAMMDGFLSFFKNIGGFEYRGEGSVKAWLKKITVNHCLMRLRKNVQHHSELVEGANEPALEDNELFGSMAAKEILELLQSLPEGYRTVFNLYVFEDMGHKEIGELLGISENTSKSQLHRARALMKTKLEHREQ
ncbi:MAG: sigma-70 family RNA polymerase sigma factor [Taibaiella sp.]|nr:sigma-70 family RNA polymerase sigma factor [Taibaiella sp.]